MGAKTKGSYSGAGIAFALALLALAPAVACDPVMGTGAGTPPDPANYIHFDPAAQTAVLTMIAGYPAGDYQFNYDGYAYGSLVVTVPVGWQITLQCENHGTVPNSCAVVGGGKQTQPLEPGWSTPDPVRGLDPGQSATFVFSPSKPGSYRIASLVTGSEASGMWADLEVIAGGLPSLIAPRT